MKKVLRLATLLTVLASTVLLLNAQTLEDVTDDSASYYGQQVTLEGVVQNFLSPHVFVLGEDTFLDNDQVLVINRSGQVFGPNIYEEARVTVSGVIQPSRDAWENGDAIDAFEIDSEVGTNDNWGDIRDDMNMNVDAEATEDMTDANMDMNSNFGTFNVDTTSLYYNGRLSDNFDNYTVLVITEMNTLSVVDPNVN